ncbi:cobyrinate a,c-diamide synthase [soil metagenome]
MVTAALARYYANQQKRVRVFKVGPDFLDPMLLHKASGYPVENLDLWMMGEHACQAALYEAACSADLILIEGVMGLFDGDPSTADLAQRFGIPIVAVIDASGTAQTLAAVGHGLSTYRKNISVSGIIANNVASPRHEEMIRSNWQAAVPLVACLTRQACMRLPERHLGLIQASEVNDLDDRLNASARLIENSMPNSVAKSVRFERTINADLPKLLNGVRIAVARDEAFSFIYEDNLRVLKELGATLSFFSPLHSTALPPADSIYLPGGYPELHAEILSENTAIVESIRNHANRGLKVYAECGGMMYLMESITALDQRTTNGAGILPGQVTMEKRLQSLGYQFADLPRGRVHGHTFHYSKSVTTLRPGLYAQKKADGLSGEAIYTHGSIKASYLHLHFRSNPDAVAAIFRDTATIACS